MSLRVRTIVDQRLSAVEMVDAGVGVAEVARRFGVSRQAVYLWKRRHEADLETGLEDRSRRPHHSPTQTAGWVEGRLIAERKKWGFGAKKILRRLQDQEPGIVWPPRSTADAIFKRFGLVQTRPRAKRRYAPTAAPASYQDHAAGEVMTGDYKGQFRMRNGRYCYPFTVADPVSRYLLACDGYESISIDQTWSSLTNVFRTYGLPKIFHTDNGIPFGTSGHGRFSTISARLMKLGVQPVYSRPAHPQDNGRHERMHRTLMERTTIRPASTIADQQALFDEFRAMFNVERPHESLGLDRPVAHHRRSPRTFPENAPALEYEPHFETYLIDVRGRIRWRGRRIFFADAFANELVAFEPIDYSTWRVHYGAFVIGTFDDTQRKLL